MGNAATKTADEITSNVKDIIDRILSADITSQIAETGRDVASTLAEVGGSAAHTAGDVARDAASSAERAWGKGLGRTFGDLWKRREVALGAAGAAVPASKELIDAAAVRLGLKKREEAHWGNFFLGLILGAIAGAAVALLTAPRPGREIRDEIAARAREAGDWVPVFQRDGADEEAEADATTAAASGVLTSEDLASEMATGSGLPTGDDMSLGNDTGPAGYGAGYGAGYDTEVPPSVVSDSEETPILAETDEGSLGPRA